MSVEVSESTAAPMTDANGIKSHNGVDFNPPQINGVSNGHHTSGGSSSHKSSSKDKHREKDREKEHKGSSGSKHHKSSSRDKHSSSSSSKDKHRDKERDGSSNKHDSTSSGHRDKDKEKHKSSSSSSSHHKSSSSSKDKERDRRESSTTSVSSKDKDRHHKSSSSSSSRDKDKDKDRDRHHKSSSSSSSKHKHSTSSSSKSSSKDKQREKIPSSVDGEFIKPEPISQSHSDLQQNGFIGDPLAMDVKGSDPPRNDYDESCAEFDGGLQKEAYEESKSNIVKIEEQSFNASQASSCDYSLTQFNKDEPPFEVKSEAETCGDDGAMEEDDEDDVPLCKRRSNCLIADDEDEEDVPLAKRKVTKFEEESEEDVPLIARKKSKKDSKKDKQKAKADKKKRKIKEEDGGDYSSERPNKKKVKKGEMKTEKSTPVKGVKREKKVEEEPEVWKWWEEEKRADGVKWNTLEHKGPVFAPAYERLPKNVRFFYDGKEMHLSEETEEAATFYAKMLNHDYCTKKAFNDNFFKDFRKTMNAKEREIIKDFNKCNFEEMHQYFVAESEKRKAAPKEEKQAKKLQNEELIKEYGFCVIDGHKEKIGNFRLEPPGLFRGRGEHPKMGMIKRRLQAEDVSINCSKDAKVPEPPQGHRWKEVRHDNTVTWLASWIENVQGQVKYIMLNPSSKLKGEKDHVKYETARRLAKSIDKIRSTYRDEWKSKEMRVRQRAVALYFIDKLALRAGNEKDEDQADTVGCCSLRVEHVQLHKQHNGKENVVVFDFLGKDSIRYYNEVEVEKRVFKNLELFMENKKDGDDLFDRLNTQVLNDHLKELMDGLTAKVFRTYNASITLQNQLVLLTEENMTLPEKLLAYNRANRAVAVLCNHQRSVPKGHEKSMENLKEKIRTKREVIDDCEAEYHDLKKAAKRGSVREKIIADKKAKQLERLKEQLKKLELQETDRDENKTIALGTSKLNYLDPRITVAWCKKHDVPLEKIFNKTQRDKFLWAIHMADENYVF